MNSKHFASIVLLSGMVLVAGCGRSYTVPPLSEDGNWDSSGTVSTLPTGTVQGRVVDSTSGLGVADVRVEVVGVNPTRYATTDNAGNFVLNEVPATKVKLSLDKTGYTYNTANGDVVADVMAGSTITTSAIKITRESDALPNSFITAFGNVESPRGLAIDSNTSTLYAVTRYDSTIKELSFGLVRPWGVAKFNLNGGFQASFGIQRSGLTIQYLNNPQGLTIDRGGNAMVVDQGRDKVFQYSTAGSYMRPASNAEFFAGLKTPSDMAVLRTGQYVVADAGNSQVLLYNVDGTRTRDNLGNLAKPLLSGCTGLKGVAVDADDNVYVIDNGGAAGSVIKKIDPTTGKVLLQFGYLGGRGAGYFEKPSDLAIDNRNGDIYVVDSGNNRVQRFNHDGAFLSEFGGMGPANGQFNNPSGIAVDANGNVYVADTGNHRIQKFAPSKLSN